MGGGCGMQCHHFLQECGQALETLPWSGDVPGGVCRDVLFPGTSRPPPPTHTGFTSTTTSGRIRAQTHEKAR